MDFIYSFRKLDLFAQPVRLKVKRTRNGKASDYNIGSWLGALFSLAIVAALAFQLF